MEDNVNNDDNDDDTSSKYSLLWNGILSRKNKPDRAKMRPGRVSVCIDHVTYVERQMDE